MVEVLWENRTHNDTFEAVSVAIAYDFSYQGYFPLMILLRNTSFNSDVLECRCLLQWSICFVQLL